MIPAVTNALADEILADREVLGGVAPDEWYDRLEREDDALQASLRGLRDADPERGLEIAGLLWAYWVARGRLDEGSRWLGELLDRTDPAQRTAARGKALYGAGVIAFLQGRSEDAEQRLRESLVLARALADGALEADALVSLARVAMFERDAVGMETRARESAAAARLAGDERRYATALHHVAEGLRRQGRYDEADPLFLDAIERHRGLGDRRSVALELHNFGRLARATGEPDLADERFRESLRIAEEVKHDRLVAYCHLGLANLAADAGDVEGARGLIAVADARLASVGAALEPEYADEREAILRRAQPR
jgi:tetratricopeptide (TPR) repeat protein